MTSPKDLEQEAKFWVPDLKAFQEHLKRSGAEELRPRVYERNLRFDTPEGHLTQQGRVLRLRKDHKQTLTYKGPGRAQQGLLVRQEIEMEIPDITTAQRLLEALGYQVIFVYEKFRTLYRLDEALIALDETPIGSFVEIEGPSPDLVRSIAQRLGMDPTQALPYSYASLFRKLREHFGIQARNMTFQELASLSVSLEALGIKPAWKPITSALSNSSSPSSSK